MAKPTMNLTVLGMCIAALVSCGGSEQSASQPSQVWAGAVVVDGDPVEGVTVVAARAANEGIDSIVPESNLTPVLTGPDGRFSFRRRPGVDPNAAQIRVPVTGPSGATGFLDYRLVADSDPNLVFDLDVLPEPCVLDGEVCPDEMLPDLHPIVDWAEVPADLRRPTEASRGSQDSGLLPTETWFIEDLPDDTRLLRFASATANIGAGPLDMIAAGQIGPEEIATVQRVWTAEWNFRDIEAGVFLYHEGHAHIHLDAFERYDLLDADGVVVASSEKVSFCLQDSLPVAEVEFQSRGVNAGVIGECGPQQQSISPGFADHYDQFLPDQWIDVSGVAPGEYVVAITADPLGRILESDETNNRAEFDVVISARTDT